MSKKIIALALAISIFICNVQSKNKSYILIYSAELQHIILVQKYASNKLNTYFIQKNTLFPIKHTAISFEHLNYKQAHDFISKKLENFYGITISNYVEIDIDSLSNDFKIKQAAYNLTSINGLTSYFSAIKDQLKIRHIFKINKYMKSNISISLALNYYKMFKNKVKINYIYPPSISIYQHQLPCFNKLDQKLFK